MQYIAFVAFTFACIIGGAMVGYRKGCKQATSEAVQWIGNGGIERAMEDGYQQYRARALASDALLDRQGNG